MLNDNVDLFLSHYGQCDHYLTSAVYVFVLKTTLCLISYENQNKN